MRLKRRSAFKFEKFSEKQQYVLRWWVPGSPCRKNEVSERPKTIDLLFNTGRLKLNKRLIQTRKAIASLRWDEDHPDIPEDKNIDNCNDKWDAFCYCLLDFIEYIDLAR